MSVAIVKKLFRACSKYNFYDYDTGEPGLKPTLIDITLNDTYVCSAKLKMDPYQVTYMFSFSVIDHPKYLDTAKRQSWAIRELGSKPDWVDLDQIESKLRQAANKGTKFYQ